MSKGIPYVWRFTEMKGIYLCAFYAEHPQADLDYQDRFIERDIDKFIETIGGSAYDQ